MIPEAAVEAAAKAAAKDEDASNWHDESEHYRNGWRNRMQVGLEAAATHMNEPTPGDAVTIERAIEQIDAGEQSAPSNHLMNTGLSDAVLWSEVREWLESIAGASK